MDFHETCGEVDIEPQNDSIRACVLASINQDLAKFQSTCLGTTCVYKIPELLRSLKPECYAPNYISIGPFHSHRKDLICNSFKVAFLRDFIDHTQVTPHRLVETVIPLEDRARKFYAEPIALSSDEFLALLVIDGCFTLMFMFKVLNLSFSAEADSSWKQFRSGISSDLLLLENQLPFFLIHSLFQLIPCHLTKGPLISSVHEFVVSLGQLDFLIDTRTRINELEGRHLLDFRRLQLCSLKPPDTITYDPPCILLTASELHKCGVSFRINESQYALDILFEDDGGYLKLPRLSIHKGFEIHMRNLIAYEHCHQHGHRSEVSNFAFFMHYLVKTEEDVELMIRYGVIQSYLSVNKVTEMFTNIGKYIMIISENASYFHECKKMKEFCKQRQQRWMASLKCGYSSWPRPPIIAFSIAVIIFVCLNLVRVTISIISLHK